MMSTYRCAVAHCLYIAESSIDDFVVCALHDAPQTRGILEQLQMPAAFWAHERPIVLPIRDLDGADLVPVRAPEGSIYAWQDEQLADVPDNPTAMIHPGFDLTRGT